MQDLKIPLADSTSPNGEVCKERRRAGFPMGEMSTTFAGLTLACSQIGSALLAMPLFFSQTRIYAGLAVFLCLAGLVLAATFYLQELWLHVAARRAERTPIQYFSMVEFLLQELSDKHPLFAKNVKRWTLAMQVVALAGTAVSEVIQVGSSMYIATSFGNSRAWAMFSGICLMTPLTWVRNYKQLERWAMLAVVAVIFTACTVVGLALKHGVNPMRMQPAGCPAFETSSFFVGASGELYPSVASVLNLYLYFF
jgi:hypothetical protein